MRFALIILMAASATGCVSAVSESIDAAPEWFDARRAELSGQGYPSLKQASNLEFETGLAPWREIEQDLNIALREMKQQDPGPVTTTEADMRAWAAEQKELVAKGEEPY